MPQAAARIVLVLLLAVAGAATAAPLVKLTNYVVDGADILPPDREAALIGRLKAFEAATSNQVAVATVQTLEGQTLEDAALEILRGTGLGQGNRNNGVLLLIAVAERRIRIEVGYGLEGALPDALAGQIIAHEIGPRFKAGDMAGGVEAGVEAILAATKGEYVAPAVEEDPAWVPFAMMAGWVLMVAFIIWRKKQRRARRRAMGGMLGGILGGAAYDRDRWSDSGSGGGFGGGGFGGGGGSGGGGGASGGW